VSGAVGMRSVSSEGRCYAMRTVVSIPQSLPGDYPDLLDRLKHEIGAARTRAALAVDSELIGLYWRIGKEILGRQEREGSGSTRRS
jgi:hypothetical protein